MVFAGLLTTAENWMAFSDDWRTVLSREPKVWRFKMSEAANRTDAFGHFSVVERNQKLHELAEVVRRYSPIVIYISIDVASYARTIESLTEQPLNEPYFYLFFATIWRIAADLANRGLRERFEIIFDDHSILASRVKLWYPFFRDYLDRLAREDPDPLTVGGKEIMPLDPVFRTDDEFMPLQAADLFAWLLRKEMMGGADEWGWLRDELPPVSWPLNLDEKFLQETIESLGRPSVPSPITDEQYASLLGLNNPINHLPPVLRRRAVAASRARKSPSAPSVPAQEPPGEPS